MYQPGLAMTSKTSRANKQTNKPGLDCTETWWIIAQCREPEFYSTPHCPYPTEPASTCHLLAFPPRRKRTQSQGLAPPSPPPRQTKTMTPPPPPSRSWSSSLETLASLPPSQYIQTFYLVASAACLLTASLPSDARSLLADYGARKAGSPTTKKQDTGALVTLVAALTSRGQVPHSWFTAFYTLSVCLSLFWAWQFLGSGVVLRGIAERQTGLPSASLGQTAAVWGMVLVQAGRRVYEHAAVMKPSRSTMWWVHWVLGLGFYLFLSVAVWVEGSGKRRLLGGDGWDVVY